MRFGVFGACSLEDSKSGLEALPAMDKGRQKEQSSMLSAAIDYALRRKRAIPQELLQKGLPRLHGQPERMTGKPPAPCLPNFLGLRDSI